MSDPVPLPAGVRGAEAQSRARNPWAWIPTLYLAEGLPYVVVMTVSVIMYKRFGISNTEIALYTSWLYLPWVVKPLWSPVVDILGTRRAWIWAMQLLIGAGLAGVALALPGPQFFRWTLVFFWLLAFNSATHDIAADGFYILAQTEKQQALFVGVRSLFYRIATIAGQGLLVVLAGTLETRTGNMRLAWSITLGILAGLFLLFGLWHRFVLPRSAADRPSGARGELGGAEAVQLDRAFLATFGSFFQRPRMAVIVLFLLLYRLGEAQLVKMVAPFLLDARDKGGLALTTAQVGVVYGTVGVAALTVGGIAGGWLIARHGLGAWLWPMLFAIHLPDAVFIYLAHAQPTSLTLIQLCIAVEQFGYGFGFTAYLMYMIYLARGQHQTAHYAICTGFMAMGMMFPGMWSGWLQDHIGYPRFFTWVILATVPSFLITLALPLDATFGRKSAA
ncbi:MAG: AmpG family muropeptide MFS transporter [Candidatus Eisenbacteria bacterium]|uniref:AmpG family muropeptide MFS transporter n=1 Tax=Eiseniibacteriota bacterium TaxID=2212470 RepID=A0A538T3M7_UNCEI|nr:MAG: AmpG family muropeptide MFS transporter [Candidatus Eisenbacteria bacterium]